MIIYEVRNAFDKKGDFRYAPLYAIDAEQDVFLSRWQHFGPDFYGPYTRSNWTKPYGEIWPQNGFPVEYDGRKKRADCTIVGSKFIVFTSKAIELLGDYLDKNTGEFLPVKNEERDDLWVYRCMNCIDALDREKSVQCRKMMDYEDDTENDVWDVLDKDGIMKKVWIQRYVFKEEMIGDSVMLILPCHLSLATYVTDKFVERFKETKLTGLGFQPYWSRDRGPLTDASPIPQPMYDDVAELVF